MSNAFGRFEKSASIAKEETQKQGPKDVRMRTDHAAGVMSLISAQCTVRNGSIILT